MKRLRCARYHPLGTKSRSLSGPSALFWFIKASKRHRVIYCIAGRVWENLRKLFPSFR